MLLLKNRCSKIILLLTVFLLLTACGGGSGGTVPDGKAADKAAPAIVSITPNTAGTVVALNDNIEIEFDEVIVDYGVNNVLIERFDANNSLVPDSAVELNFKLNQKTLSINPTKLLDATKYQVILSKFKDASNNVMQGACVWQFVTKNYQGPAASNSRTGNCGPGLTVPLALKLSVSFGIKQLKFTWKAYNNADYYKLLENNGSGLGFKQIASNVTRLKFDHQIAIHKTDWINSRYLLEACFSNSNVCVPSNEVSILNQASKTIGYFKASYTTEKDTFGSKIALSGDGLTLAVSTIVEANGMPGVINNSGFPTTPPSNVLTRAGAVYIFSRKAGIWAQQAYIKPHNPGKSYHFGTSMALSKDGKTLAVGANNEASNNKGVFNAGNFPTDNTLASTSGAVYVFARDVNDNWAPEAYIKAHNTRANGYFGWSVSLSSNGQTLAVGADGEDNAFQGAVNGISAINTTTDNTNSRDSGAAYVYFRDDKTKAWAHQAYLKASNASQLDYFSNVSLSGDGQTLVIGALGEDSEKTNIINNTGFPNQVANSPELDSIPNNGTGAVYVFTSTAGQWAQQAYIKASNKDVGDQFGTALTLSSDGQTLAIGATGEASNQTGVISDAATISGDNSLAIAGAVYLFSRSAGNWTQQAYIKASNPGALDYFGTAIALSSDGMDLAVGASSESSKQVDVITLNNIPTPATENNDALNSGAVYLYRNLSGIWQLHSFIKANNTVTKYHFGNAVALAGKKLANGSFTKDGSTLAVGSIDDGSNSTGVNNSNIVPDTNIDAPSSGAVYLY